MNHTQQAFELAMSILTVESDRSLSAVLSDTDSSSENLSKELQALLGSFAAPPTNLETEATQVASQAAVSIEALHSSRYTQIRHLTFELTRE